MLADAVAYFLDFPFFFAPPAFLAAGFLGEDFLATTGFFFGEDFLAVTGGFLATFDFLAGTALLGDGAPRLPFLVCPMLFFCKQLSLVWLSAEVKEL